jgi:hypothetical protein
VSVIHHATAADAHEVVVDGNTTRTWDTRLAYTQDPGGFVGEIAAGWSFSPGLTLAGLYSVHAYRHAGYGAVSGDVRGVNAQTSDDVSLAIYGALATYHPDPSGPFHVGLAAGYATLRWDNPFSPRADSTRSSGLVLGPEVGVEGYAGEGFWIGATARVLAGGATKMLGDERHVFFAPTLFLTLAYTGHARSNSGTTWVGEGR